jgi:hypothetical protein
LKPGFVETLLAYEGQTAEQISRAFAKKFGLDESVEFMLREQIMFSLSRTNLLTNPSIEHIKLSSENEDDSAKEDISVSDEGDRPSLTNSLDLTSHDNYQQTN